MLKASMYFAYGRDARAGLQSKTTFEAILAGERTSTTRFAVWPGAERYRALKVGDTIRFFEDREMRGRHIDVVVTELPRDIDLARCSQADLASWSECEGWSETAGRSYGRRYGVGLQVKFKPVD